MYCAKCDLDHQTGAFCKSCGSFLDPTAKKTDEATAAGPTAQPEDAPTFPEAAPTPPQTPAATPEAPPVPEKSAESTEPAPTSPEAPPAFPEPAEEPMFPAAEPVVPVQPTPAAPAGPAAAATPAATPAPQYPDAQSQQDVSFVSFVKKLWDFKGVSNRKQFVLYLVFTIVWALMLVILFQAYFIVDSVWVVLHTVFSGFYLLLSASMLTRRLRDTGFRLWWLALLVLSIPGAIVLVVLLSFPTQKRFDKTKTATEVFSFIGTIVLGALAIFLIIPALLTFAVSG